MSKKEQYLFDARIIAILIKAEYESGNRMLSEDELKKALGGQKCPECKSWLLGEREADEHMIIEKLTRRAGE